MVKTIPAFDTQFSIRPFIFFKFKSNNKIPFFLSFNNNNKIKQK